MHTHHWIRTLFATLALAVSACDDDSSTSDAGETGAASETEADTADQTETDTAETDTAGNACEEPNPQGCVPGTCADGEVCVVQEGACISSGCSCNSDLGTWDCVPDCGGGTCVPEDEVMQCEGENPRGCMVGGCGDGEVCSTETDACVPSSCTCDVMTGAWNCTPDCGGGECVPEDDAAACEGENPAEQCSDDAAACIPSACSCNADLGTWDCSPDCGDPVPC